MAATTGYKYSWDACYNFGTRGLPKSAKLSCGDGHIITGYEAAVYTELDANRYPESHNLQPGIWNLKLACNRDVKYYQQMGAANADK